MRAFLEKAEYSLFPDNVSLPRLACEVCVYAEALRVVPTLIGKRRRRLACAPGKRRRFSAFADPFAQNTEARQCRSQQSHRRATIWDLITAARRTIDSITSSERPVGKLGRVCCHINVGSHRESARIRGQNASCTSPSARRVSQAETYCARRVTKAVETFDRLVKASKSVFVSSSAITVISVGS